MKTAAAQQTPSFTPVNPADWAQNDLLKNMQGNILKGHGRDHTTHIFIHFNPDKQFLKKIKAWLKNFAENSITSFKQQLKERERYKRNGVKGGMFASVLITKKGYEYLGYENVSTALPDEGFTAGMQDRHTILSDNIDEWEKPYKTLPIHAMLLLADDDRNRMGNAAKQILEALVEANNPHKKKNNNKKKTELAETEEDYDPILHVEYGHAIRNANGDGLEHNGYVDGISQPLFLLDEIEEYKKFHGIGNGVAMAFNPAADKDLVLVKDPLAPNEKDAFGSYFVYRKLEQNVQGFKKAEKAIGDTLFPNDEDKAEIAGAYIVGRFEDGTPVVLSDKDAMIGSGAFNNFNYAADPSGGKCPHFAHIRKTNPRTTEASEPTQKPVMARRGIPFGHREVDTTQNLCHHQFPASGVGLLFMSFQASITGQFEVIQKLANDPGPAGAPNPGIDPVIGQGERAVYDFPKLWGTNTGFQPFSFEQFIHMKGGEYFFAPSIPFFDTL